MEVKTSTETPSMAKSSSTIAAAMKQNHVDSNYCHFSHCLRDANCECEMCVASFQATLDLVHSSTKRSSLTKYHPSKSIIRSPIAYDASVFSTPLLAPNKRPKSPDSDSTARPCSHEMPKITKYSKSCRCPSGTLVLSVLLILIVEIGLPQAVSRLFQPRISPHLVRNIAANSSFAPDMRGKLGFLQKKLGDLAAVEVSNCSDFDSGWMVNKDGLLLHSKCSIYESAREEIKIWGWPLQTSGLLTAEFSSRSFTILSGSIREWADGKCTHVVRTANSSWVQKKWTASAVHLDPHTWILEYQKNFILENSRALSTAIEFLKYRVLRLIAGIKQELWQFPAFEDTYNMLTAEESFLNPT